MYIFKCINFCSLVKVSDVLWNLYSYYKQFIPCIEQSIQEMRKPIEKDLKVCNCNVIQEETHCLPLLQEVKYIENFNFKVRSLYLFSDSNPYFGTKFIFFRHCCWLGI